MHKALIFTLLLTTWLIFSGKFDAFHVGLGVLSSLGVTFSFGDLLFSERKTSMKDRFREIIRLPGYLAWLVWQVLIANLHVLRLALAPSGPEEIKPRIVRFKTALTSPFARFVFAQSITLTPGTVTVTIDGDELIVHAISRASAEGLAGAMERRIAHVYQPELLEGGES
jgi:multicomponent Na+:H+ antiporter subunit E